MIERKYLIIAGDGTDKGVAKVFYKLYVLRGTNLGRGLTLRRDDTGLYGVKYLIDAKGDTDEDIFDSLKRLNLHKAGLTVKLEDGVHA